VVQLDCPGPDGTTARRGLLLAKSKGFDTPFLDEAPNPPPGFEPFIALFFKISEWRVGNQPTTLETLDCWCRMFSRALTSMEIDTFRRVDRAFVNSINKFQDRGM